MSSPRTTTWTLASLLSLVLALFAPLHCAASPAPPAAASGATAGAETVAVVAGTAITASELEEALAAELRALEIQRHQLLEAGLDRLIEERLLTAESTARGASIEELLAAGSETTAVTDAEVDAWYEQNAARVGQPKEAIFERIREFLGQQRQLQARETLIATLRSKYEVDRRLEPLRFEVATGEAPAKGPQAAAVTLVEFSDFQCPACRSVAPAIQQIQDNYGDRVRVVFRQFPLRSIHPQAQKAAEAALCASDQGRFWEMHDALFANQGQLGVDQLKARAAELELDTARFDRCLDSNAQQAKVDADLEAGRQLGVGSTPSLFINGRPLTLMQSPALVDQIASIIDDELARSAPAGP
jgi:protein-disulfide isomerase